MSDSKVPFGLLLLLACALYYMLMRGRGDYFINKALFEVFVVGSLYAFCEYGFWVSRYKQPHVTVAGHCGSIQGRPHVVGDWAIFPCGFALYPVPLPGKISTLVVPKNQIRKAHRSFTGLTSVKPTPLLNLPPEVNSYVEGAGDTFNKENIFFGRYSEQFILDNYDTLPDFEEERENLNRQINVRNALLRGNKDILTEELDMLKEFSNKGKPLLERIGLKRQKKADEEE